MNIEDFPTEVRLSALVEFIHTFAPEVSAADLREVTFDANGVTVVLARRDDDGRPIAAGNELATVTVTYALNRD